MEEAQTGQPRGGLGSLLACSLLIAVFDVFVLGLAIAFGPSGFGGDRTMSAGETAAANIGQAAGLIGALLAGVALVVFLAMRAHPRGRAALGTVLGAQAIATLVLVLSTR